MMRDRTTVKLQPGLFLQPFVVSQLIGTVLEDVVEGSGISSPEFAVTSSINIQGSVTPTELARTLGMAPTTLSATIDRLVRKGQVRRRPNPDDGRSYVLELTAKGKATNARIGTRFEQAIGAVRGNLDGDPADVLEALRRLEDALRATLAGS
jgi:DNA-binding MarR family transcriptional regulator